MGRYLQTETIGKGVTAVFRNLAALSKTGDGGVRRFPDAARLQAARRRASGVAPRCSRIWEVMCDWLAKPQRWAMSEIEPPS